MSERVMDECGEAAPPVRIRNHERSALVPRGVAERSEVTT
jgi:hypothetical protein